MCSNCACSQPENCSCASQSPIGKSGVIGFTLIASKESSVMRPLAVSTVTPPQTPCVYLKMQIKTADAGQMCVRVFVKTRCPLYSPPYISLLKGSQGYTYSRILGGYAWGLKLSEIGIEMEASERPYPEEDDLPEDDRNYEMSANHLRKAMVYDWCLLPLQTPSSRYGCNSSFQRANSEGSYLCEVC